MKGQDSFVFRSGEWCVDNGHWPLSCCLVADRRVGHGRTSKTKWTVQVRSVDRIVTAMRLLLDGSSRLGLTASSVRVFLIFPSLVNRSFHQLLIERTFLTSELPTEKRIRFNVGKGRSERQTSSQVTKTQPRVTVHGSMDSGHMAVTWWWRVYHVQASNAWISFHFPLPNLLCQDLKDLAILVCWKRKWNRKYDTLFRNLSIRTKQPSHGCYKTRRIVGHHVSANIRLAVRFWPTVESWQRLNL